MGKILVQRMTSTISANSAKESPVLLIGAAGRLGDMVMKHWPSGRALVGSARRGRRGFIQLDLLVNPESATNAMSGKGAVLCLAGVTPAVAATGADVFSRNTDMALAALRAAKAAEAGRVFIASSAAVYSGTKGALTEDAVLAPQSEYGRAKAQMEQEALDLAHRLDHPLTVLRIGNVAGADAILGGWRAGFTLDQLPDDSTPARSYIGPRTLAKALHQLAGIHRLPDVLNLAAPGAVQMGALLDAARLDWTPRPASQATIANVTLSTKRLETHVRFAPEDATPHGLVAQWRAYQSHC